MAIYSTFPGGDKDQYPEQARLTSGFVSGDWINTKFNTFCLDRAYRLSAGFDGSSPEWGDFINRMVNKGAFADGDAVQMLYSPKDAVFKGLMFKLMKDLPSGISLTVTIESALQAGDDVTMPDGSKAKDSFVGQSIVVPAGSKAGSVFLPAKGDETDATFYGFMVSVAFSFTTATTPAPGAAAPKLLDTRGIQFAMVCGVDNFQDNIARSCTQMACATTYPALDCIRIGGTNVTPAMAVVGAVSTSPTPVEGGSVTGGGSASAPASAKSAPAAAPASAPAK